MNLLTKPGKLNNIYLPGFIIFIAAAFRIFFYTGHVFSDDAYYTFLAHNNFSGLQSYLGYPVFPLRAGYLFITAISFKVFGAGEVSSILFNFIFSLAGILLVYYTTELLTKKRRTSLIAAFLYALFPTDVIFASIAFPDLINVFFINAGVYLLIQACIKKKWTLSLLAGFLFSCSIFFKENISYYVPLLLIAAAYMYIKKRDMLLYITIPVAVIAATFIVEGTVYYFTMHDFLYRLHITEANYNYSYYDFFPYTLKKITANPPDGAGAVLLQLAVNLKSIFLRRYYLFIPLIALLQLFINYRKKEYLFLSFWLGGLLLLYLFMPTSFVMYKPLDMQRSWYIYPLIIPVIILAAIFLNNLREKYIFLLVGLYVLFSIVMCYQYQVFFQYSRLAELKNFLRNSGEVIYTDHFTKYSVDLIQGYKGKTVRITPGSFKWKDVKKGGLILYNKFHVDELVMQKYKMPDFNILNTKAYRLQNKFGDFLVYKKISD